MPLPERIAALRRYLEDDEHTHLTLQPNVSWAVASAELSEELEAVVIDASNHEPESLDGLVEDYESVTETLDDLAPILYRPHIKISHSLLLAHSGHFSDADHILTELQRLLRKQAGEADDTWLSAIYADIALTEVAKGRLLEWRGEVGWQSLCRYKAALNEVRRSARVEFQAFVHDQYFEVAFRAQMFGLAMHVHAILRQLRRGSASQHPAILDRRLWQAGFGSSQD